LEVLHTTPTHPSLPKVPQGMEEKVEAVRNMYIMNFTLCIEERDEAKNTHINETIISFNFLCNTLFYWLKNWGDFVSPEKKSIHNGYAQMSQNTQAP
jgi:hypothetical protein